MNKYIQLYRTACVPSGYDEVLDEAVIAYETYGQMTPEKDNAILIIHGFSGHSHVASHSPGDSEGWWEWMVGPDRILDPNRYFVVCMNNLGSCFGTSGPASINPKTGKPFGKDFPSPTISQMVWLQQKLQDELGIPRWHAVIGGSLGGMAALEWAASFPAKAARVICLNAGASLSYMGCGLVELQAELLDIAQTAGMHAARRLADLVYLSEEYFRSQKMQDSTWSMSSFLSTEADQFIRKFDFFSYRCLLDAMQQFDLRPSRDAIKDSLAQPVVSIVGCQEDILFPPHVLNETRRRFSNFRRVNSPIVSSPFGHDAFLLDTELYSRIVDTALNGT